MRYPISRRAVDSAGNVLPGTAFSVYPFTIADTWATEAANGDWSVNVGARPAAVTVFASPDEAVATPVTLTATADGTTPTGWLPPGMYTIVAEIGDGGGGTRYHCQVGVQFGPDVLATAGDAYTAGSTLPAAIVALDAALTALTARVTATETEVVYGQFLGSAATFAALSSLQASDRSPGDIADLTVADVGTGTAESPQYPAGRYKVQPNDSFAFDRAYGEATAAVEEIVFVTADPTGNSVPAGAKLAIDTVTGRQYRDNGGSWAEIIEPASAADPSSMTFVIG